MATAATRLPEVLLAGERKIERVSECRAAALSVPQPRQPVSLSRLGVSVSRVGLGSALEESARSRAAQCQICRSTASSVAEQRTQPEENAVMVCVCVGLYSIILLNSEPTLCGRLP